MSPFTSLRALALAGALALAVPALASAHPAVFTQTTTIVRSGAPSPPTAADLITRTEYYIQNDGRSIILQETNGVTDTVHPAVPASGFQPAVPETVAGGGVTNFKQLPSTFRANTTLFPTKASWLGYVPAHTDVQVHATCVGPAALSDPANIAAWQNDPFYNYIPWQKTSAGIGDDPAKWIPVVKDKTGVDLGTLATVAELTTACGTLGGTYFPADAVLTTPASTASASVADAVAPVQAAKAASDQAAADASAARQAADGRTAAAQADLAAARTEITRLQLAATPLRLTLDGRRTSPTLVTQGQPVKLTGPPLQLVRVRLLVGELTARRLGLKSRVLATRAVTSGAGGALSAVLKPTAAAAAAIRRAKGALPITVDALAGQKLVAVSTVAAP
jgi:hypothetical protein